MMTSNSLNTTNPKLGTAMPSLLSLHQFLERFDEIDMLYPAHVADFVTTYKVQTFQYDENNKNHIRYKNICETYKVAPQVIYVKDTTYYDMMKLLQSISHKRKGEQYREIKAILPQIEKNWARVVCQNQNKHIIHFLKLCRSLNIHTDVQFERKEKFKAQMMAINTILRIPHTVNNIQNASDSISDACIGFSQSMNHLNANFEEYNNIMSALLEHFKKYCEITTHVMVVLKFIALVYLLTQEANLNVTNVACLVTLILPVDAIGKLSTVMLAGLIRAVQSIRGHFNNVAQVDTTNSVVTSFWEMFKLVTIGLLSPIDKEKYQNLSLSSAKVRFVAQYLRDASTIFEYIFKLFSKLFELLSYKIMKMYGYLPTWCREDAIDGIIQEYQDLQDAGHLEHCVTSIESCKKVVLYFNKLQKLEADTYRSLNAGTSEYVKFKILPYLRFTIIHIRKILDDVPPHVRNGFEGFRNKPYWIYIHGESDIGKSSSFQPVLANALAAKLKLVDNFDDPHNYSYFRTCGAKYFSKYHNQPIMQYNDLFQNFTDEEKMNEAVVELTNIIDEAPYELNMADVESKGKYYCTSKIVITNAQYDFIGQQFITNKCWSGGVHLYRRRNVVIELCAQNIYRKKVGTGIDWAKAYASASTRSKYIEFIPADLYSIKFTDPITGHLLRHISFDDGIDYILADATKYFAGQNTFHDQLLATMRNTFQNIAQMNPVTIIQRMIRRPDVVNEEQFFDAQCNCRVQMRTYIAQQMFLRTNHDEYSAIRQNKFLMYLIDEKINEMHEECCLRASTVAQKKQLAMTILYSACMDQRYKVSGSRMKFIFHKSGVVFKNAIKVCTAKMMSNTFYRAVIGFVAGFTAGYALTRLAVLGGSMIKQYARKKMSQAQSDEGTRKAHKTRVRRRLKATGMTTGVAQYDQTNRNVEDVVKHNMATFMIRAADSKIEISSYMRTICVGGSVFIIPRHYYHIMEKMSALLKSKDCNAELVLKWYNQNETVIPWTNVDVYMPDADYLVDVCFFRIRRLTARRDIRHFWVRENDDLEFNEAYLYGVRAKRLSTDEAMIISVDGVHLSGVEYIVESINVPTYGVVSDAVIKSPAVYEYYNCKTVGGDCGSVLIFCNSKLNGRVMAGIHVGGSVGYNTGFSAPIFVEDIDEAITYFNGIDPVIVHEQEPKYNVAQVDTTSAMYESLCEIKANIVGSTTFYKGKRIKAVIPRKSNIVQSCVHEYMERDFGPPKTAPARLRPFVKDGELISPFIKAYKKTLRYCPQQVPMPVYNEIITHIYESVITWKSDYTTDNCTRRVLNDDEMINGIVGMKQLDLSTSPGFPYVFDNNTNGKRPWFEVDRVEDSGFIHYKMINDLRDNVERRLHLAKQGVIMETYFIDTLKDEPRPIDKVKEGKTRLFQIGPMDLSLCIRKYFGCFIAHLHSTYIDGESAVGIDANSMDWHYMFKLVMLHPNFGAGDHREFDYSSSYQICMSFADVANAFYDDGDVNKIIRLTLVATCVNAYHIVDSLIIYSDQGNNSGVAITTDLNNNTNMFISRLAYKYAGLQLETFNKDVRQKCYGDDDFKNISDRVIDKYNMLSISRIYRMFGFDYTSCNKDGISTKTMPIEECTFLKRHIVANPEINALVGQLDKNVIEEIPRWSESDPNNMSDQMNRFNSALMEATNYGRPYYDRLRSIYSKYIRWLNSAYNKIDATQLLSYDTIMKRRYEDRYCNVAQVDYEFYGTESHLMTLKENTDTYVSPFMHPFRLYCNQQKYNINNNRFYEEINASEYAMSYAHRNLKSICLRYIYDMVVKDHLVASWVYDPFDGLGLHAVRDLLFELPDEVHNCFYQRIALRSHDNPNERICLYDMNRVLFTKNKFFVQLQRTFSYEIHQEQDGELLKYELPEQCLCLHFGFINSISMTEYCFTKCIKEFLVHNRFKLQDMTKSEIVKKILLNAVEHVRVKTVMTLGQESMYISNALQQAAEQENFLNGEFFGQIALNEDGFANVAQNAQITCRKRHDLTDKVVQLRNDVGMLDVDTAWEWVNLKLFVAYCHKPTTYLLTANSSQELIPKEEEVIEETVDLLSRCCFNTYRNMLAGVHAGIKDSVNQKVLERMIKYLVSLKRNTAQADKIEVTQKTTQFYEQSEIEEADIVEYKPTMIFNPAPDVNMENFFERPICVANYKWTSTAKIGAEISPEGYPASALEFPSKIFMYPTFDANVVRQKMNNVFLMRPDIEITIRINTTSMHYGRLMFVVYPMLQYISKSYKDWRNASGAEWYQISANKEQSVRFVVPFRHVYDWMELTSKETGSADTATIRNLFTLVCYVAVPLSVSIGTAQPVQVQVYARFINANLCGFTSNAMFAQSDTEVVTKTKSKTVVSDWIAAAADFVTCFDQIPVIGGFAKPIGYTVAKSAKLLKRFGYSVPINVQATTPVTFKGTLYNTCDDNPVSTKLAISQDSAVSKDFDQVHDTPDCLTITHICQRPFLLYTGKITSNEAIGAYVWRWPVSPCNVVNTDYVSTTIVDDSMYVSAMAYLSFMHKMWRGSIRMTVSFCSSNYHSMRCRLVWNPVNNDAELPEANDAQNCYNIVCDINDHVDYSFTIPYMQEQHWLSRSYTNIVRPTQNCTNGLVGLQVLSKLTSISDTINPIYFQVFVSAGEDFQLAIPTNEGRLYYGVAQMDKVSIGELPTSSHIALARTSYPSIGGVNSGIKSYNKTCSNVTESVRQLITGLTPMHRWPFSINDVIHDSVVPYTDGMYATVKFCPYGSWKFSKDGLLDSNNFYTIKPMFLFHRGSVRISIIHDVGRFTNIIRRKTAIPGAKVTNTYYSFRGMQMLIQASAKYKPGVIKDDPLITYTDGDAQSLFEADHPDIERISGFALGAYTNENQFDITLPYNSVMHCRLNSFGSVEDRKDYKDVEYVYVTMPIFMLESTAQRVLGDDTKETEAVGSAVITVGTTDSSAPWVKRYIRYVAFLAAGDDYIMGVQLPIPKISRTPVVPPVEPSAVRSRDTVKRPEPETTAIHYDVDKDEDPMIKMTKRSLDVYNMLQELTSDTE